MAANPTTSRRIAKLCLHKTTGRAVVRLSGQDVYCGKFGTAEAKAQYDKLIIEWLQRGRARLPAPRHPHVREYAPDEALGLLARLKCGTTPDGYHLYDLRNRLTEAEAARRREELQADIAGRAAHLRNLRECGDTDRVPACEGEPAEVRRPARIRPGARKVDGLRPVYLPARVFAPSPRAGLTPARQNVLIALTLELTPAVRRNDRPDQAAVVTGGAPGGCPRCRRRNAPRTRRRPGRGRKRRDSRRLSGCTLDYVELLRFTPRPRPKHSAARPGKTEVTQRV